MITRILRNGEAVHGLARPMSLEDLRWVAGNRIQRRFLQVPGVMQMPPLVREAWLQSCIDRVVTHIG